ncbi:CoA transferase [Chelativorans sp. Marseille-P2723]|uniref:CaiB/BaiF CoA transferase family protein n=1 Tax=Chelativorans sp. Marseille-P2723 TaxID=2709133 RepID=UPI00156F36F9|nr:CoA transferase [Chelativorans sp. Marseille-P2723]
MSRREDDAHAETGSLAGLKVIDLSRVLGGPYCSQILADHGADVIKVEPPQGDETRAWGPPFQDGNASYFQGVNRNKRGIVLNLKEAPQREMLCTLLETADVLLENFKPGTLEGWGLTKDAIQARFPRLIHCRVSGFGEDGPMGGLPGYDAAVQAMVGLMSVNGDLGGRPTRVGVPVVDLVSGLNAAVGILLALHERERSGKGQFVDITLYDCGISLLHPHLANYFMSGKVPTRSGNAHPNISPYDSFATADGEIFLAVGNEGQFSRMCDLLGVPELATRPEYRTNGDRNVNREALRRDLERLLSKWHTNQLAEKLIRSGVPCGPVLSIDNVVDHPHTSHREMLVEIGEYRGTASPIKLSRTPASYRRKPPKFGEHNSEVLKKSEG